MMNRIVKVQAMSAQTNRFLLRKASVEMNLIPIRLTSIAILFAFSGLLVDSRLSMADEAALAKLIIELSLLEILIISLWPVNQRN